MTLQVLIEDMVVVLHGEDFDYGIGSYERCVRRPPHARRLQALLLYSNVVLSVSELATYFATRVDGLMLFSLAIILVTALLVKLY